MKIAMCQLNSTVGNFSDNLDKIEDVVENVNYSRADIFLFPELFLMGYPPRDLLDHKWFINQGADALDRLCEISKSVPEKLIITGLAIPVVEEEGEHLFNSAVAVSNGKILFTQHKRLLPTYDVFDEHRYFNEASEQGLFTFNGVSIGLTICEDMWNTPDLISNSRYKVDPVAELAEMGADIILNISASPFHQDKESERLKMIKSHVATHRVPFIMVNSIGANDELIFDGGSLFMNGDGVTVAQLPLFEEVIQIVDSDETEECICAEKPVGIAAVHDAIVLGIRDYFSKCGFSQAAIGLSGGIDSAVTAALACTALGPENVMGITMPSMYSSEGSISDSVSLANNLGMECHEIAIKDMFDSISAGLAPLFEGTTPGLAEENIQARTRGVLLMSVANKFGRLVLNTGNKSEMAVGYCTLYGDMNGALSVLADIYKTDVYKLAEYINRDGEVIPVDTITKAPSAELRPDQKDQDSLPEYDMLDAILKQLLEDDKSGEEVIASGYEEEIVRWVIRAIKINEYKRRQSAPVLKVTPKAFGMGRRFPIAARYEW